MSKIFTRFPAFWLTLGLIGCLEAVFTFEWSFPYCSSLEDGAASAVFGMPFPYVRWSQVSSMEYEYAPFVWLLNLTILFGLAFPFVFWAVKKFASDSQKRRAAGGILGLILAVVAAVWTILLLQVGLYKYPVAVISDPDGNYKDFRPVKFTFKSLDYDCTPSNFWFGERRQTPK